MQRFAKLSNPYFILITCLNRDILIFHKKYYLILNLMAKTCLKKAGIGTTKCWNDFTSYSIIKRIRECGEIFVFMGQYWTASGLWALRKHRH